MDIIKNSQFIVVNASVLPEIFVKVLEVKKLLASREEKSSASACKRVGISRSAYYKYRDCVFSYEERLTQNVITISAVLRDEEGVLSNVLSKLYSLNVNILTLNQSVPVDGVATVTVSLRLNKENGYVYISCREIPSKQTAMTTLEFVCRDTGIGMAEAFQKRIFEPFAQEHAGSRTKFAGTGLGMPITKKLVEKMGGTISFESKEGTGTTFVIRIPFQIDADMKDRNETEEKTETSIQGLHVLLTEDNELNMEIAEFVLQNEGAVVTKAWNGQKAVDIFRKSRPGEFDVILMDIMMPVMNGYEAAKMIRSLDREDAKVIPIIAMTANAFTEDKMRAKEAGMDEHIAKPVDGKLLVKVINELVKHNQREKL